MEISSLFGIKILSQLKEFMIHAFKKMPYTHVQINFKDLRTKFGMTD